MSLLSQSEPQEATLPEEVYLISFICTVFSMTGLAFIITFYLIFKNTITSPFYKLVYHLALSDMFWVLSSFMLSPPSELDSQVCNVMAMAREFGLVSSLFWAGLISWTIMDSMKVHKLKPFTNWYCLMVYGPSVMITAIPVYYNAYGVSFIYCWIVPTQDVLSWVCYMGLFIAMLIFITICYVRTLIYLRNNVSEEVSKEFYSLLVFPTILFVSNIWSVIDRMYELSTGNVAMWLTIVHVVTRQSQGALNSIAYGCNYAVRKEIAINLKKCWKKTRRVEEDKHRTVNLSIQEIQNIAKLLSSK